MASRIRPWAVGLCAVTYAVALLVLALQAYGALPLQLGFVTLRAADNSRTVIISLMAALVAVGISEARGRGRWPAWTALVVAELVGLIAVARGIGPTWPTGDAALLEVNTILASRGQQFLGAYSQFGWYHPGPLMAYWAVPFYVCGGRQAPALSASALALNLFSLQLIVATALRGGDDRSALAPTLSAALAALFVATPLLITSYWNPHVVVYPTIALLVVAAAATARDRAGPGLPITVFLGSLVAQAHAGLAPTAGLVSGLALGLSWVRFGNGARSWINRAAWTGVACWLWPLSEQLTSARGNLSNLATFFLGVAQPEHAWRTTLETWGGSLAGVLRSDLTVPLGLPLSVPSSTWPSWIGAAAVCALPLVGWREYRRMNRLSASLACFCFATSLAGLWSVSRIRGQIADHQVFWLAGVGLLNLLRFGAAAPQGGPAGPRRAVGPGLVRSAARRGCQRRRRGEPAQKR